MFGGDGCVGVIGGTVDTTSVGGNHCASTRSEICCRPIRAKLVKAEREEARKPRAKQEAETKQVCQEPPKKERKTIRRGPSCTTKPKTNEAET